MNDNDLKLQKKVTKDRIDFGKLDSLLYLKAQGEPQACNYLRVRSPLVQCQVLDKSSYEKLLSCISKLAYKYIIGIQVYQLVENQS